MVFAQAFEVGENRVLGHGLGFFQRVALSDQAGQRRTSHNEAAFVGELYSAIMIGPLRSYVLGLLDIHVLQPGSRFRQMRWEVDPVKPPDRPVRGDQCFGDCDYLVFAALACLSSLAGPGGSLVTV